MDKLYKGIITLLFASLFFFSATSFSQAQTVPTQCIGEALADYMNAVVDGTKGLSNIRLLSPVFNITNPAEVEIFDYMAQYGAKFGDIYGYAGNTYSHVPGAPEVRAMEWYDRNFKDRFFGSPVIFTEFGDFNLDGTLKNDGSPERQSMIYGMYQDFGEAVNEGIHGVNYFNAFGQNDEFDFHELSDDEIQEITGNSPLRAGVNSATYVEGGPLQEKIHGLGLGWSVEITTSPDDIGKAVSSVEATNVNVVLRLCVGDSCGFSDPATLVSFLRDLNSQIDRPVYVIAGPNEPATEHWAAPECKVEEEIPDFDPQYVPCNQVAFPEFHSLRPYPASPCNTEPQGGDAFMCANDLVINQKFEFHKGEGLCEDHADGSTTCIVDFEDATMNMDIGLKNAQFPIMGNTELVPNALKSTNQLENVDRVNEYVSWYLNGVIGRAEEKEYVYPTDIDTIINLSGPIRKLIPHIVQSWYRGDQKKYADLSFRETPIESIRHNQIVACQGAFSSLPIPCYDSSGYYLRRYVSAPGFFPESRGLDATYFESKKYWPYVPMSSTEDLIGQAHIAETPIVPLATGGQEGITKAKIDFANGEDNKQKLYFPHMEETDWLGGILQRFYLPTDPGGLSVPQFTFDGGRSAVVKYQTKGIGDPSEEQLVEQREMAGCEILESRTNKGDRLYGGLERFGDTGGISGTVTFSAHFICEYPAPADIDACVARCVSFGDTEEDCTAACLKETSTCKKEVNLPFSVQVATPKAKNIWGRFVDGSWSIFRRMFPRVGPNTPVEEIKDIPAAGKVGYGASDSNAPGVVSTDTYAGDPGQYRPGSDGNLYFAHIGSVQEYFLHGIQDALRPFGFSEVKTDVPFDSVCPTGTGYCSVENLMKYFDNDRTKATKASIICQKESGSNPYVANKTCTFGTDGIDNDGDGLVDADDNWDADNRFDGGTLDYSIGLFQINLLAHCPSAGPHYDRQPDLYCTFDDEAAKDSCEEALKDPEENIKRAVSLSRNGTRWTPWSAARVCGIN